MAVVIINTVGTSLASKMRDKGSKDSKKLPKPKDCAVGLAKLNPDASQCGAEINSITSICRLDKIIGKKVTPPYKLYFLVSDTDDGRWTGETLKHYYKAQSSDFEFQEFKIIEKLTDEDSKAFKSVGLRNLVKEVANIVKKEKTKNPEAIQAINATGGYKAQIAFAALIGQALEVPVFYKFERFPEVIEMPPMPVDFDYDLWLENLDMFHRLFDDPVLYEDQFPFEEVDHRLREMLDCEKDKDNGKLFYSLSPVLELMHQAFLTRGWEKLTEPKDSTVPDNEKIKVNEKEMSHAPRGTREFLQKLVGKYKWINRVSVAEFMNTPRTHLLAGRNKGGELEISYSDGEKGARVVISTTCENENEVGWCKRKIALELKNL